MTLADGKRHEPGMGICASGFRTCPKHPSYPKMAQMGPWDDEQMAQDLTQSAWSPPKTCKTLQNHKFTLLSANHSKTFCIPIDRRFCLQFGPPGHAGTLVEGTGLCKYRINENQWSILYKERFFNTWFTCRSCIRSHLKLLIRGTRYKELLNQRPVGSKWPSASAKLIFYNFIFYVYFSLCLL